MNYNVFPFFPRDHGEIPYWQSEDDFNKYPIFAKDQKDVPDWLKLHHQWEPAFDVNKLQKHQLKVKMCCSKCEEIVIEEIREVRGVFDVRAERKEKKVVVVAMPSGLDEHEVLRKARKVHKKAKFVELDAKEKQKPKGDNKKDNENSSKDGQGHGHGQDNKGEGGQGKKDRKELQTSSAHSLSSVALQPFWGQQAWPIQSIVGPQYYYPPTQLQRYPDPHGQYVYFL